MNHLAIIRILAMLAICISGTLLLGALLAFAFGELKESLYFLAGALSCGPAASAVLLLTDKPKQRSRAVDGLAVAVLFWFLAPVFCAIPFLAWTDDVDYLSAYFEAVSCLTTTGQSGLSKSGDDWPASLILWRALLHIGGAVACITIAATVLSAINLGGPGIHRSRFFTLPETSFFVATPRVVRAAMSIVTVSIVFLLFALILAGASPGDAFSGAVSAITTGLVDPDASLTAPANAMVGWCLGFGLIVGSIGLIVLDEIGQGRYLRALKDPEVMGLFVCLGLLTLVVWMSGLSLFPGLGWAISSLSTSGIALTDPEAFTGIPLALAGLPLLIGGSALSAAGGIKLARVIVLSKRAGLEFIQLGYRGSVQTFRFRGRPQSEQTIIGVWVYLVGYTIAIAGGLLVMSMLGLPFTDAVRASIGSLTNSGHFLVGLEGINDPLVQLALIFGMVLGRLEVIALLPVLSVSFWR